MEPPLDHSAPASPAAARADGERERAVSLAALEVALGDGWERCAPELQGGARAAYRVIEEDWRALMPDVRPAWDAWSALRGVVIDERRVSHCREVFAHADCSEVAAVSDGCLAPFTGALAIGDGCSFDRQCTSGACRRDRCAPADECSFDDECGAGMACTEGELGNNTCVAAPHEGEDCSPRLRCAEGHWCDEWSRCRVTKLVDEGEPCAPRATECPSGHWCLEGRCLDMRPLAAALQPTPHEETTRQGCACPPLTDGSACVGAEQDRACAELRYAGLGERCDDTAVFCRGTLRWTWCRDGTCVRAGAIGDPCDDHEQCGDELRCVSAVCVAPAAAGAPCATSAACAFGLTCDVGEGAGGALDRMGTCVLAGP